MSKQAPKPETNNCRLCAHIRHQLIGSLAGAYKDREGRVIALPVSERLRPPQGLALAGKPIGLCLNCSQYVLGWLEMRGQVHMQQHAPAGGKILVATPGMLTQAMQGVKRLDRQVPGLGRMLTK